MSSWQENKNKQFNNGGKRRAKESPYKDIVKLIKDGDSLSSIFKGDEGLKRLTLASDEGWSYKIARNTEKLKTNQIRKILSEVKSILDELRNSTNLTDDSKKRVFMIVPMIAYASGRGHVPKDFYELIKECLTFKNIKTIEDFKAFDEFITNIVAYKKVLELKN